MSKIAPVYSLLNKNLLQFGIFHELFSIDESMIPYYGRHSAKMFIRGKPIRFGYKTWCLCGNDGYPYFMVLYQGKETNNSDEPLGTRVVMTMLDIIPKNSEVSKHQLNFDNFFTSYDILAKLAESDMRATGTVRENRTMKVVERMTSTKDLKKKGRGSFDFCSDGKVYIAKWHDNAIVTIASNWETHDPVSQADRRVKGGRVRIKQPHLIKSYNKGMGGVDLMDRLLESYRPMIRGKNVPTVSAWRLHSKVSKDPMTHLNFRRVVTLCLLRVEKLEDIQTRAPSGRLAVPDDIRYDKVGHTMDSTTQGRCKVSLSTEYEKNVYKVQRTITQ